VLSIAPALLRRLSGEGLAFPDIRSRAGLSLVERLHAMWPALTSADGWGAAFSRELNATDDRALMEPANANDDPTGDSSQPDAWPVIEGKHLHPFAVHAAAARFVVPRERTEALRARLPGVVRHRLAYRDVSSATNRMTLIAAILPPFVVSTHTLFCLRSPAARSSSPGSSASHPPSLHPPSLYSPSTPADGGAGLDLEAQHCLCALMNSFVANYLVRLRVSTHVTVALLDHLPMPRPLRGSTMFRMLSALAVEEEARSRRGNNGDRGDRSSSSSSSSSSSGGSDDTRHRSGSGSGSNSSDDDAVASRAQLQAWAAHAYGLTTGELGHVLATFPLIDEAEKRATLAELQRLI
jgi:hypothetical protein